MLADMGIDGGDGGDEDDGLIGVKGDRERRNMAAFIIFHCPTLNAGGSG